MRWRHDPRWAYVFVNLATLFWAGNVTLGRALRDQMGPFTLAAARVGIAALLFLILLQRLPAEERRPGRAVPGRTSDAGPARGRRTGDRWRPAGGAVESCK